MEVIYGTSNKNKVISMTKILKENNVDARLYTLEDIGFNQEIIEDGKTFEENSAIKPTAIKKFCDENNIKDKIIITDDAGLCIDKLNGEPGVYSARYAGKNATQVQKLEKILDKMKKYEKLEDRKCVFVCVLTAILPSGEKIVARGECKGAVAKTLGKLGGLTYVPIFIPEGFDKPLSNLDQNTYEATHNHRDIAVKKLINEFRKRKIKLEGKIIDSYKEFLNKFNINEEKFLDYGRKSIIYVNEDEVEKWWNDLKERVVKNKKVYIRGYGNNGQHTKIFLDFIQYAFGNTNIKVDSSRNRYAQTCIKKYTGLARNIDIQNYQVSHIFEMTKNPFMFECPWNLAYIPKIFDPFTGHESNGEWSKKFKKIYLNDVKNKFQKYIDEYNELMEKYKINKKIEKFIEEKLNKYNNKQLIRLKKDLIKNFNLINKEEV